MKKYKQKLETHSDYQKFYSQNLTSKRWFDDWEVIHTGRGYKHGGILIKLPYSHTESIIEFRSVKDARVNWLIDVVDCALNELTKKSKWVGEFAPNCGHDPNNPFPLKRKEKKC